jgi:hypothetical protein
LPVLPLLAASRQTNEGDDSMKRLFIMSLTGLLVAFLSCKPNSSEQPTKKERPRRAEPSTPDEIFKAKIDNLNEMAHLLEAAYKSQLPFDIASLQINSLKKQNEAFDTKLKTFKLSEAELQKLETKYREESQEAITHWLMATQTYQKKEGAPKK